MRTCGWITSFLKEKGARLASASTTLHQMHRHLGSALKAGRVLACNIGSHRRFALTNASPGSRKLEPGLFYFAQRKTALQPARPPERLSSRFYSALEQERQNGDLFLLHRLQFVR